MGICVQYQLVPFLTNDARRRPPRVILSHPVLHLQPSPVFFSFRLGLGCLRMFCIPAYDDDAFKQPFLLLLRCLFVFQSRIIMHRFVVWFFGALPGPAPPSEISKVVIIEIQFCFHLTQRRRIYCNERRLWAEHEALLAPEPVKMRSEAIFIVMRHKANYRLSSSWT